MCGKSMQNLNRCIGTLGLPHAPEPSCYMNGASGTDARPERSPVAGHPCGRPSGAPTARRVRLQTPVQRTGAQAILPRCYLAATVSPDGRRHASPQGREHSNLGQGLEVLLPSCEFRLGNGPSGQGWPTRA